MTRASADTPWATRNGAGTRRAAADAGASLSDRSNTTMAIAQHATHGNVSGTALRSMLRTTPRKTNKVGAATASRAVRFARNCATVGRPISEKYIAASIAISGIAKARARHPAALSHDKRGARRDDVRDVGVEALKGEGKEQRGERRRQHREPPYGAGVAPGPGMSCGRHD